MTTARRILLVDDNENDYYLTRALLSEARGTQFILEWASTFEKALDAIDCDSLEAILVDYGLGDHNGIELARALIERGCRIPIIFLTGQGSYELDMEAMKVGVADYLSKNEISAPFLERTIRYAIERKQTEEALRQANEGLAESNQLLEQAKSELESRVIERTQELMDVNIRLSQLNRELEEEVKERKLAEEKERAIAARNQALAELSRMLAEAGTEIQQVLDTVARQVSDLVGDGCTITLLQPDGQHLRPVANCHPDPQALRLMEEIKKIPYHLDDGPAGQVAKTGQAILIPTLSQQEAFTTIRPEYHHYLKRFRIHSLLIVPLRVQGQAIGTLGLSRNRPDKPYDQDEQVFIQEIADRCALSIFNAQLFNALQSELLERQRTEEELRKSEARFRTIFYGSNVGIKLVDLDGTILACNPAFQQMLGYREGEINQMKVMDFTDPLDIPVAWNLYQKLASGEIDHFLLEKRYHTQRNETLWVRQNLSLVRDEHGTPQFAIGMVENITERKQVESELAEVQRRLMDSREEERIHLSQELHDGPVQAMYGVTYQLNSLQEDLRADFRKLLDLEGDNPEISYSGEKTLGQLSNIMETTGQTIRELRAICSELRPPALAPFGLEKAIRSHVEKFQQEHPEISIELDLVPDGQALPENVRLALYRIIQNGLANAARHARASQVNITFHLEEDQVMLKIKDNGQGFTVPKRWIDFVRTGHLGLAGAAERAQAIGGTMQVISQPGQGTLLEVVVPRVEKASGSPQYLR